MRISLKISFFASFCFCFVAFKTEFIPMLLHFAKSDRQMVVSRDNRKDSIMQLFENAARTGIGNCIEKASIGYSSLFSNPRLYNYSTVILCECYTFDRVFIPMLRYKDHNNLKQIFLNHSFRLITMNDNLSLVYSIISAFQVDMWMNI